MDQGDVANTSEIGTGILERIAGMNETKTSSPGASAVSRRRLLRQAAAGAALTLVPRHVLGGRGYAAPSEKINIAGIGIGGVGRSFLQGCADEETARIAFLCDVDDEYAKPVYDEEANKYIREPYRAGWHL